MPEILALECHPKTGPIFYCLWVEGTRHQMGGFTVGTVIRTDVECQYRDLTGETVPVWHINPCESPKETHHV